MQENTFEIVGALKTKDMSGTLNEKTFGLAAHDVIVLWTERMQTSICYWQNMYTITVSVHTTSK